LKGGKGGYESETKVFYVLNAIFDFYHPGFDIYLVAVVLITTGCVYIFKDKKNEQAQNNKDTDKQ
jgi:hypothetical protein